MPASPPAGAEVSGVAAQPEGWFVQYPDGSAREVVAWALLLDNSGAVPMVFSQEAGKLLSAGAIGSGYVLVHSHFPDNSVTLAGAATEPGTGPSINLGGLFSRKSSLVEADPGTSFLAILEGSLNGEDWFPFGPELTGPGVVSEVLLTIHYARVRIESVSGGAVTIRLAWSLCHGRSRRTGVLPIAGLAQSMTRALLPSPRASLCGRELPFLPQPNIGARRPVPGLTRLSSPASRPSMRRVTGPRPSALPNPMICSSGPTTRVIWGTSSGSANGLLLLCPTGSAPVLSLMTRRSPTRTRKPQTRP